MRIGIIGAGTMGSVHAAALRRIEGVHVVAVGAREVGATMAALIAELGCEALPSAEAVCARPDVDAVVIAVPTDAHAEIVTQAARVGKDIFCEKPLARTLQQGEAMLAAVAEAGVKLAVGHVVRYFPEYAAAHELVQRGELGTPGVVRTTRGAGFPQVAGNWYADVERSGGVVLDMMIHDFDWLRWTFGPIERLYAQGLTYRGRTGKDGAMAIVRFSSGAVGYVEGSWSYPSGFRTTLEVSGSAGLIRTASQGTKPLTFELAPTNGGVGVAVPTGGLQEDPYLLQLRDVVRWFGGGPAPRSSGQDALEALLLSLATLESIRSGRPISFGDAR